MSCTIPTARRDPVCRSSRSARASAFSWGSAIYRNPCKPCSTPSSGVLRSCAMMVAIRVRVASRSAGTNRRCISSILRLSAPTSSCLSASGNNTATDSPIAAAAAAEIGESVAVLFPDAERQDEVGALSRSMEEMQRRLVPAERLATLTRMATIIAHDLRTPLLGVEQGLQGLRYIADPQLNAEARALLEDLHTGSRLAVGIVQDILDLYRQAYGELPLS